MGKKDPPRRSKPKFHAADVLVDGLVIAGVSAPLWDHPNSGLSAGEAFYADIKNKAYSQALPDMAYNLRQNALSSIPTAVVLVGSGIAVKRGLSYLRQRGMLRSLPL